MIEKTIKQYSALIKIAALIAFGTAIFFAIYEEPQLPEKVKENFKEVQLKTFGGPEAESGWNVKKASGDGYILAASTASFSSGPKDAYLIKTDDLGNLEWTRTYGEGGAEDCLDVIWAHKSGYLLVGSTTSFGYGESDVYVVKTGAAGMLEWDATYGGDDHDAAYSVLKTNDGGYVIAGYSSSFSEMNSDAYVIKIDGEGGPVWDKTFGRYGWDVFYSVENAPGGGYIAAGYTGSKGAGKTDIYVIRMDSSGNSLWARTYGGKRHDRGICIKKAGDNGYIIAAKTMSYASRGFGWDTMLMRIDAEGNSVWSKTFPATGLEAGNCVAAAGEYIYYTAIKKCYGICKSDILAVKADLNGNILWEKVFTGGNNDISRSCLFDSGGVLITGNTLSYGNGRGDVFLTKISQKGEQIW